MKNAVFVVACLASLAACETIQTNGNDTSFQRVGPDSCPGIGPVETQVMVEVEGLPVRCGPQTQSIEPL